MKYIFKIIASLVVLLVIVFLAYNIKTIPNYSKESGQEVVWKSDYDKYNQGYCLAEDRILSEEEVLRISLSQYFEKKIILDQKLLEFRIYMYGSGWKRYRDLDWSKYDFEKPEIAYYSLDNVATNDFNDKFFKKYDFNNKTTGLLEVFFGDFGAKKINPMDVIQIKGKEAHLQKAIIYLTHSDSYALYLKKFMLVKNSSYSLMYNYEGFPEGYGILNIKQSLEGYKKENNYVNIKLDNCGNIDFNIEKIFERVKDTTSG